MTRIDGSIREGFVRDPPKRFTGKNASEEMVNDKRRAAERGTRNVEAAAREVASQHLVTHSAWDVAPGHSHLSASRDRRHLRDG